MSNFYDRTYKVKVWVLLEGFGKKKSETLMDWFKERKTCVVEWPGKTFYKAFDNLKSKGWAESFKKDSAGVLNLDPQVVSLAFFDHLKAMNPKSVLDGITSKPIHHLNRQIISHDDYERLFNDLVQIHNEKIISFAFNIGELCHFNENKIKVFVTDGSAPHNIISSLADNVLTIKQDGGDISLKGLKDEQIHSTIIEKINNLIK